MNTPTDRLLEGIEDCLMIEEYVSELRAAEEEYEKAREALNQAQNRETDARNRLNRAQGAFDDLVEKLREGAPNDSDWARKERHR